MLHRLPIVGRRDVQGGDFGKQGAVPATALGVRSAGHQKAARLLAVVPERDVERGPNDAVGVQPGVAGGRAGQP